MNDVWKAWLERGKKDMNRATEAFAKRDYEHAAYMTQQALEKHVKSVLAADGVEELKSWRHDILTKFVKDVKSNIRNSYFDHSILSKNEANTMACEMDAIIKCLKCDDSNIAVWKHSLGVKKINEPPCFKERKITVIKLGSDVAVAKIQILRKKTKSQAHSHASSKKRVQQIKIRSVSTMAFLATANVLIETFPHLTYGRYPDIVGGVSTTGIYTRHAEGLRELMVRTDDACAFLAEIAESVSKMRGKFGHKDP